MITIKSFGSGSSGNCALVENEKVKLLIDCGIQINSIIKNLNIYNILITDLKYVLVTHVHIDHTKSIKELEDYGLEIFANNDTIRKYNIINGVIIDNARMVSFENLDIIPLEVQHGECNCYGFILHDKDSLILWLTDFLLMSQDLSKFPFTEIYIETNYCDDMMKSQMDKISSNDFRMIKYKRQINTHSSLNGAIKYLSMMNLSKCHKIIGIHLSNGVSNAKEIKTTIENKFGIPTYTLDKSGKEI